MGDRTILYVICLGVFPVAFAAFVVGFGMPTWIGNDTENDGLWQTCRTVVKSCSTYNFDTGGDWMIAVRVVEIFALVMFVLTFVDLVYENCNARFTMRPLKERLNCGVLSILGGLAGLAGVIVYVVKLEGNLSSEIEFAWGLYAAGSGAGVIFFLGIGFVVSAIFFEKRKQPYAKNGVNGHGPPYVTSNDENYELSAYTNRGGMFDDNAGGGGPSPTSVGALNASRAGDNLPGFSIYNGMVNQPGYRSSLSTAQVLPPFPAGRAAVGGGVGGGLGLQPAQSRLKGPGYYSISGDDRGPEPGFDLSEGYQPAAKPRPQQRPPPGYYYDGRGDDPYNSNRGGLSSSRREDPYDSRGGDPYSRRGGGSSGEDPYSRGGGGGIVVGGRGEDPYSRGGGGRDGGAFEDPYSRYHREPVPVHNMPPRAGYNDPYGFDRRVVEDGRPLQRVVGGGGGGGGGDPFDRAGGAPRDSFYRPGRF